MELWDLFDENRQPLGRTHVRGEALKPGEHHVVTEIWTVNSAGQVLVTLRHPEKETYPDKWENTGGSAVSGDTSRQSAVRELFEETGITATEDELTFLDTYKTRDAFVDTYILRRDLPIEALTMQEGETVAAKWVTPAQLDEMAADGTLAAPIARRLAFIRQGFDAFIDAL